MSKVYYLVKGSRGSKKKNRLKHDGVYKKIVDVARGDPLRKKMVEKLKDDDFRRNILGFKGSAEDEIRKYNERVRHFVDPSDMEMCVDMYRLGTEKAVGDGKKRSKTEIRVTMENGTDGWFDREDKVGATTEICTYDKQHDGPLEDLPEDVSNIAGFGVAALLIVIRRTLIEKLQQFTYVGDVVIAVNPYMYLPKMVRIDQPPEVKNYEFGKDPTVYATAHFSYWGLMDSERYFHGCPKNQSCIVSGESGAGKTVSCGQIMKYLANMSDWTKGITRRQSSGNIHEVSSKTGGNQTVDVTKLVGGVSPFLEAFGNANTMMNDNSSRFGKFMKILFSEKGRIVGGEVDHYLLEKGRLSYQGKGERSFHIFYFLLKGATLEERSALRLKKAEEYAMLFGGGRTTIRHEDKRLKDGTVVNTYDEERMNNPLDDDPDHTGCRAALVAAGVTKERQAEMWRTLAALLKMGDLEFESCEDDDGNEASRIKNAELLDEISKLLGLDHVAKDEGLGKMLCIYRRVIPGEKPLDSPVPPPVASFQRFALIKDIYARMFDELMRVVNRVLDAHRGTEGFIGILDIFGFEVFEYNSMEQLCINFANEKLQKLFNEHIFVEEGKVYRAEDLPLDVLPPFRDNTPCCNLIERRHVGIFPMLDDLSGKKNATDEKYARSVFRKYGFRTKPGKNALSTAEKKSSAYLTGKETDPMYFIVRHFAGDVRYHTKGWLEKNEDKLPPQIPTLLKRSSSRYVSEYVYMKNGLPKEDRDRDGRRKRRKPKKNTIACKFVVSLAELASTLNKTNPHYVRCVKPNDAHMRPCDGAIAFDAAKTYRQLLYAGVMEVCKIKKEGYPFRETYERFWTHRCIGNKWINAMVPSISRDTNPKDGVIQMCKAIMPGPRLQGQKPYQVVRPTWVPGKTMIFGKDYTLDTFQRWHKLKVAALIEGWTRHQITFRQRLRDFARACASIQNKYRRILEARRFALFETRVVRAQGMVRAVKARKLYASRRDTHRACRIVQRAHRQFWRWKSWNRAAYQLERVEMVRETTCKVQRSWKNYRASQIWSVAFDRARKRDAAIRIVRARRQYEAYLRWITVAEGSRKRESAERVVAAWRGFSVYETYVTAHGALVRDGSAALLEIMAETCARTLAVHTVRLRLRAYFRKFRILRRVQKHVRGAIGLKTYRRLSEVYANMKRAEQAAKGVWLMQRQRRKLFGRVRGVEIATTFFETIQMRAWIHARVKAIVVIQRFARWCQRRTYNSRRVGAACMIQNAVRFKRIMRRIRARQSAIVTIEKFLYQAMMRIRCTQWIEHMQMITAAGDVSSMMDMMNCPSPYRRMRDLRHERVPIRGGELQKVEYNGLVNLRDRIFLTSFLHTAVNSGSEAAVDYLLRQGADAESLDIRRNTPLHLAAADGDRSLSVLKSLLQTCTTRSNANAGILWVLSHEGSNVEDVTVLDKAVTCAGPKSKTVSYLKTRGARFHLDLKQEADRIAEHKRNRELAEQTDMNRLEQKISTRREGAPFFKYAMLDPHATDRRAARLRMSPSQIAADKSVTAIFTVARAKAKFKSLTRKSKNVADPRVGHADSRHMSVIANAHRALHEVSSVEDEVAKAKELEDLAKSTMVRMARFREKLAAKSTKRLMMLSHAKEEDELSSKGETNGSGIDGKSDDDDGPMRPRSRTLKDNESKLAMWSAAKRSAALDRDMDELEVSLRSARRGSTRLSVVNVAGLSAPMEGFRPDEDEEGRTSRKAATPTTEKGVRFKDETTTACDDAVDGEDPVVSREAETANEEVTVRGARGVGDVVIERRGLYQRIAQEEVKQKAMQRELSDLARRMEDLRHTSTLSPTEMRPWILRALVALERLGSETRGAYDEWGYEYLDANGRVYGPFKRSKMRSWFRKGHFSAHLPVRYASSRNAPFVSISELYQPSEGAFEGASSPVAELRLALRRITEGARRS